MRTGKVLAPAYLKSIGVFSTLAAISIAFAGIALGYEAAEYGPPCQCSVAGEVTSWKCVWEHHTKVYPYGEVGVELRAYNCIANLATVYSGEQGTYEFPCLPPYDPGCPCCVEPMAYDTTGFISAYDAALILSYVVGTEDLEMCPVDTDSGTVYPQLVAADVTCNNQVTALDAAQILRYVVGDITTFDCPDMWLFYPDRECVDVCHDVINFRAVCKGDVSGPAGGGPSLMAPPPAYVRLGNPRHYDQYVEIPVVVADAEGVSGFQLSLGYETEYFTTESVETGELTSGFSAAYSDLNGTIMVAMAGAAEFEGSGEIALIILEKDRPRVSRASGRISLESVLFNEGTPSAIIEHETYRAEVYRLGLGPIAPNPFAESTVITFSLNAPSRVRLCIYSVTGQVVRTVHEGWSKAGIHSVEWDGTDSSGQRAARGIYFCRFTAEGQSRTEKVMLLN